MSIPISVLGSRNTAEIVLAERGVAPSHAAVIYDGQSFWVRDLVGGDQVCVNGEPVLERGLPDGAVLTVCDYDLKFRVIDTHMLRVRTPMALAECALTFAGQRDQYLIDRVITVIGSGATADVPVFQRGVQTVHALMVRTLSGLWIQDMATVTGTFVNGARVDQELLRSGDCVQVGHTQLTISVLRVDRKVRLNHDQADLLADAARDFDQSNTSGLLMLSESQVELSLSASQDLFATEDQPPGML